MQDSVFTKMLKGEIDHTKLYEDDQIFVILDSHPLTKGHALVIPKQQIDHLDDCSPELYTAIFQITHKISKLLKQKLNPVRIGLVVHGFEVPHAHIHVVPLYTGKELHIAGKERETPSFDELNALQEQILA